MYERHGESKTRLYNIWIGMRQRCGWAGSESYQYYGGRGISVCEEWDDSFSAFQRWAVSAGYRSDKSIDRINVNGNYEPENCRWSTDHQQARNKNAAKSEVIVTHAGETLNLSQWSRKTKIGYTTLVRRYLSGKTGYDLFQEIPKRRSYSEITSVKESGNGNAKLTEAVVAEILASPLTGKDLANKFKVSPALVSMIRNGKRRA
jgi:hypothetical protein